MSVKLLTEHHLKFLSIKRGCTGSSESIFVKMPHCWKSHATAHITLDLPGAPFFLQEATSLPCNIKMILSVYISTLGLAGT